MVDTESSGVLYLEALKKRPVKIILCYTLPRVKWEALVTSGCIYSPQLENLDNEAELIFQEDNTKWITELELRGLHIAAVIPGSEKGVDVADLLAHHFGVPGNAPHTISHRRNKVEMKRVAREHGLRCAQSQVCLTQADALAFGQCVGLPIVLKTPTGAGTHHVFVCHSESDLAKKFDTICLAKTFTERAPTVS